ncbi:MAG TPA: hypothetical protein VGG48_01840 [Rhizomicrobium sp.]|jgi:hypothetical protein
MTTPYGVPKQIIIPKIATVYQAAQAITPTDNSAIGPYQGLYIGVAGDVTVVMRNGDGAGGVTTVLFKAVPVGLLPIAVQGVNATGTTATNIVGLG